MGIQLAWSLPARWQSCVLTITLLLIEELLACIRIGRNSQTERIPSDSSFQFSCVANAASYQRVTISQNGAPVATFGGVGEGVQMAQAGGATTYSGATRQAAQFSLLFQHSRSGPSGPFLDSVVTVDTTAGIVTTIATEDSIDRDSNDTVLTLVVASVSAVGSG